VHGHFDEKQLSPFVGASGPIPFRSDKLDAGYRRGASVYLNGFTGFMAGVVPPPRTYVTNYVYVYHYSGDAGADLEIPIVGSVEIAEPRAARWLGLVVP